MLQQMKIFSANFSPEQVGHSPLACKLTNSSPSGFCRDLFFFSAVCNLFHRFTELLSLRRKVCASECLRTDCASECLRTDCVSECLRTDCVSVLGQTV